MSALKLHDVCKRVGFATRSPTRDVPDVVAPPPGNPRFPAVEGLRAIAALSVLCSHVALVGGGGYVYDHLRHALGAGVTIFFVISGFLLYRPFVAGRLRGGSGPRVRDFARRRVLRIVPAYWLALTCLAVLPGLPGVFGSHWWRYYGLIQTWFPSHSLDGPVAWSLSVEATYYVILAFLPLAATLLTRWRVSWLGREVVILAGLFTAAVAWRLHPVVLFQTPVGYLLWFLAGMALAVASVAMREHGSAPEAQRLLQRHSGWCWLPALGVASVMFATSRTAWDVQYCLRTVYASLIVVPAVFVGLRPGRVARLLTNPVLRWLGLISYGIYLWHYGVLLGLQEMGSYKWLPFGNVFLSGVIALAVTVLCAAVSYYLVEAPLLRLKYRGDQPGQPLTSQHLS